MSACVNELILVNHVTRVYAQIQVSNLDVPIVGWDVPDAGYLAVFHSPDLDNSIKQPNNIYLFIFLCGKYGVFSYILIDRQKMSCTILNYDAPNQLWSHCKSVSRRRLA